MFGPTLERQSKDFDSRNRASMDTWSIEEDKVCIDEYKDCSYATVSIPLSLFSKLCYPFHLPISNKIHCLIGEYNQQASRFYRIIRRGLLEGHQVKIMLFRIMIYGMSR